MPGYREALIETAVCLNAAQAAFDLRQEVERTGKWEIEVLYGVYNLHNHQVCMPNDPSAPPSDENVRLAYAPANPRRLSVACRRDGPTPEGAAHDLASGGSASKQSERIDRRRLHLLRPRLGVHFRGLNLGRCRRR